MGGIFGFVDKVLGTDFSGDKARKQIDKATAAAQGANAAAAETMKQYGAEASRLYEKYLREGMDETRAAEKASGEAAEKAFGMGEETFRDFSAQAVEALRGGYELSSQTMSDMYDRAGEQARTTQAAAEGTLRDSSGQAMEALQGGFQRGEQTLADSYGQATGTLQQGYQQGQDTYTQNFEAGQAARQPYIDAGTQMLGAVPQLAAALGLPGAGNYDVTASPLYQWQMQQMDEQLANQLAAMGVGNDTVAAYIRSKNVGRLGAEERERQVANLQQMAGMGLQAGSTFGMPEYQAASDLGNMQVNQV